ncbi:MAG: peptidase MA family protein [Leptospira sp.]|nr:peptidase MA family protein [Leptospira sp.]
MKTLLMSICFLGLTTSCGTSDIFNLQKEKDNRLRDIAALYLISNVGNCETGNDIWARNLQNQSSYCVAVDLVSDQTNVIVYKERSLYVNYDLVAFAKEFNDQTYPKLVSAFGAPSDIDKNGKVIILVLDVRDNSTTNSAYVAGYFDPVNYFTDGTAAPLRSNYGEILYMDGKELIASLPRDPQAFASTAAHEFQHLIRYPYMNATRANDDTWINEGTSEVASDIAGFGPQSFRLNCFNGSDTSRCSGGGNGISLLDWNSGSSSSIILKQYAMAYAYMRYLYDISGGTEAQKNTFFRKTVQGASSGIRAGSASQLMSVFQESTRYNATYLGSTNPDIFFRTFMLFFGQASGVVAFSNVEQIASDKTTVNTIDLSAAYAAFPFESSLSSLVSTPVVSVTGNLSLTTGSAFVVASNLSASSISNKFQNMGTVKNTTGSPTPTKTIVAWAAYSNASPLTSIRGFDKAEEGEKRERYRSLIETESPVHGHLPLCGTQFINEPVQNVESILIEPPASKSGNIP